MYHTFTLHRNLYEKLFLFFFCCNDRRKLAEKNARIRAGGGTLFALRIMVSIKMGLMENAEKENGENEFFLCY
jgi:hypothetical protein